MIETMWENLFNYKNLLYCPSKMILEIKILMIKNMLEKMLSLRVNYLNL